MRFYDELQARGLIKQVTDPALAQVLEQGPVTLYIGFDPTSDSLHVGSLMGVVMLKRFQMAGHKPIAVVGGATGMIGDPSGKSAERSLLDDATLAKNVAGITRVFERFLDFKGSNAARVVNNASWFKPITALEFLRDIGKHFSVNMMMAKDSVRARLEDREHGISYTEFSYMLLQAYDFYHLYKDSGCKLQVGGSDQWGNITAGTDLIRRKFHADSEEMASPAFGFTHPLIMKSDGTKFGKSEQGTLWLDPERTSPYQLYQYFIQTPDADAMMLLNYFTFLSLEEIAALGEQLKTAPEKRAAQAALAREITRLVHGDSELAKAEKASQALFGEGIRELDERQLLDVMAGAPRLELPRSRLAGTGLPLIDALAESGLCQSKGAARKDVTAGGVYVNNERRNDANAAITESDLIAGKHVVLRKGKKTYQLISFN